ncbi:MAG: hypothetical protein H0T82_05975 [Sphingomonas sp.]|nr:hypothetical protein [Sphingomonas sp.]
MRRSAPALALLLAACATQPTPAPLPQAPAPAAPQVRGNLIGLSAGELIQRFGQPALQVREGRSLKLQFRGRACVLDAFLYPPLVGMGPERVAHVDTRLSSGADTDQLACIRALGGA